MTEEEFVLAMVGMVLSFATAWGIGYAVYAWFRRRNAQGAGPAELVELRQQIAELQTSVDAVAVELERVSEGQRFTTRLLSERPDSERIGRGSQS